MENFSIKALDSNQLFINKYKLIPKISYLTLLFYQFAFVKEMRLDDEILCSHFEDGYHVPFIVIARYNKIKRQYILKRLRFNEDIYKNIKERFDDNNHDIVINDELLKSFNALYDKLHGLLAIENK